MINSKIRKYRILCKCSMTAKTGVEQLLKELEQLLKILACQYSTLARANAYKDKLFKLPFPKNEIQS